MADKCPKCGAAMLMDDGDVAPKVVVYECCSLTTDGKFYQNEDCRIRQLEGLLRRAITSNPHPVPQKLYDDIREALERNSP